MNPKIIIDATEEPISLGECYEHLRIDYDSDEPVDSVLISLYLKAAREHCEQFLGCSIANKVLEYTVPEFQDKIFLPFSPVNEIVSVTYEVGEYDSDGIAVSYGFLDYVLVDDYIQAKVSFPSGSNVKIRYLTGYGFDSDAYPLPSIIKIAILLTLSHFYENRQDVTEKQFYALPNGVQSILRPYRERLGMA